MRVTDAIAPEPRQEIIDRDEDDVRALRRSLSAAHPREEDEPEGWQMTGGGWAEYRLVATPSPRDESAAGSLGSFELFKLGSPYLTGPAGSPGRLVDSAIVRWK